MREYGKLWEIYSTKCFLSIRKNYFFIDKETGAVFTGEQINKLRSHKWFKRSAQDAYLIASENAAREKLLEENTHDTLRAAKKDHVEFGETGSKRSRQREVKDLNKIIKDEKLTAAEFLRKEEPGEFKTILGKTREAVERGYEKNKNRVTKYLRKRRRRI